MKIKLEDIKQGDIKLLINKVYTKEFKKQLEELPEDYPNSLDLLIKQIKKTTGKTVKPQT